MFHIHLYGRTKESKVQIWGEALKFPNPDEPFYDNFTPFNDEDIEEIKKKITLLENTEKYKLENLIKIFYNFKMNIGIVLKLENVEINLILDKEKPIIEHI